MKRFSVCLLAMTGLVAGMSMNVPLSRAGEGELQKKIDKMRKELDELNAREKEIAKQRADLQKAIADLQREASRKAEEDRIKKEIEQKKFDEADRKKHYVKVELRGKLMHSRSLQPQLQPDVIYVTTNETRWPLVFAETKEQKGKLREQALKLVGKPVIISGHISTTAKRLNPLEFPYHPEDVLPQWPRYPLPRPGIVDPGMDPRIQPYNPYRPGWTDVQLPVAVESIRLVEEK